MLFGTDVEALLLATTVMVRVALPAVVFRLYIPPPVPVPLPAPPVPPVAELPLTLLPATLSVPE